MSSEAQILMRFHSFPSRYICTVFDEMRTAHKNHNYSYLTSLIDEANLLASRMEAALEDIRDLEDLRQKRKELKKELQEYQDKKDSQSTS